MLVKLSEDSRNQLLSKARQGANYKGDKSKGKNRYERRTKSKISNSVKEYNQLNMNKFFKEDILDLYILVHGETDDYLVGISFSGILELIREETKKNPEMQVDLRLILQMLKRAFNREDHVLIRCDCPDWRYRMSYFASVNDIILGDKENRPSDKTNPDDKLGPACKHVILVLSNNSWIVKLASAVSNYINYIKDHYEANYAEIIFPQLYGMPYNDYVQLGLFDKDELDDTNTIVNSDTYKSISDKKSPYYIQDRDDRLEVRKAILNGSIGLDDYKDLFNKNRDLFDVTSSNYVTDKNERKRRIQNAIRGFKSTEIASANKYGGSRTQFKRGNVQGIRFAPNEVSDDDQLELDLR